MRPRACDFRRLRFSRNASFSRSCLDALFASAPARPSALSPSSFIVNPFECVAPQEDITGEYIVFRPQLAPSPNARGDLRPCLIFGNLGRIGPQLAQLKPAAQLPRRFWPFLAAKQAVGALARAEALWQGSARSVGVLFG